jgi:hypothetical protein
VRPARGRLAALRAGVFFARAGLLAAFVRIDAGLRADVLPREAVRRDDAFFVDADADLAFVREAAEPRPEVDRFAVPPAPVLLRVAVDRVFFGVPIMAAMPAAVTAPRIALPSMILSPERIGYPSTGQNPDWFRLISHRRADGACGSAQTSRLQPPPPDYGAGDRHCGARGDPGS